MNFFSILLLAFGLAMDAFAVSISCGITSKKEQKMADALRCGIAFGVFQSAMVAAGWVLGAAFSNFIEPIDHWIAFVLLAFIGGKMIFEAIREESEGMQLTGMKMLLTLALATSIDAMAAGIGIAAIGYSIVLPIILVGVVALVLSFCGVLLGCVLGNGKCEKFFNILGGVILIGLGIKILIEHLCA